MLDWVSIIFLVPLTFATLYSWFSCWLVLRFKAKHLLSTTWSGSPPVTVLCPLHGEDEKMHDNLEALCRQEVKALEIRFGVDNEQDPAVRVVQSLKKEYPDHPLCLTIASTAKSITKLSTKSINRKVSNLVHLSSNVRTPLILAIDQDIRVSSNHLKQVLGPFESPDTGLVTCLYRIGNPTTLGSIFEMLSVHGDFFSSVLVGEALEGGLGFAFGATLAIRLDLLKKVGGFEALEEYLADDHELGCRVRKEGHRVVLSGVIVTHDPGKLSLSQYWNRSVRAARTHRVCRPVGYALSLLTQGLPWVMASLLLWRTGIHPHFSVPVFQLALLWGASRFVLALLSHALLTCRKGPWWPLVFLPIYEIFRFFFWILAFTGNQISWGGIRYEVLADGRMRRI